MTTIVLTWAEAQQAALEGTRRRLRALANGRQHRHGYDGADNWSAHIEAAAAEMAVAKHVDRFWAGSFNPDYHGDIGIGLQVRHTLRSDGRLLVHPDDPDDHVFVLVRGEVPTFEIVGAIKGGDAKQQPYWRELQPGRPCFVIEQAQLKPLRRQ